MPSYKLLILLLIITTGANAQTGAEYLAQANKAYDAKQPDNAKALYLKAAALNEPDAHFALFYKYVLPDSQHLYHLLEAARAGKSEAVGYMFEELVFRANSLTKANPALAMEVYKQALKVDASLSYDFKTEAGCVQKCLEAGPFDAQAFFKKYNIKEESVNDFYGVWELAEEASHGGRFGKPHPKLVFQLVCRGSSVPAEGESAINDTYLSWKKNKVPAFNICDYITSGMGMGYCAHREDDIAEANRQKRIKELKRELKNNAGPLLDSAYQKEAAFISSKAGMEEGSGGTGRVAWVLESEISQEDSFVDLIELVNTGKLPPSFPGKADADKKLNEVYHKVLKKLKENPVIDFNSEITDKGVRETQRLWMPYRDATAKLLSIIMPRITIDQWNNWLTSERVGQLERIGKED